MVVRHEHTHLLCSEIPSDCTFRVMEYVQKKEFHYEEIETHCLVYCLRGHLRISSNLFAEEVLSGGEVMFLPRLNDYRGSVQSDSELLIHAFNNTVCRPEQCILAYLYSHRSQQAESTCYRCKMPTHAILTEFFQNTILYVKDGITDYSLWQMKHMELIWLFTRYYAIEDLRSFFYPITHEQVAFKSLVLTHYRKANKAEELAELCGYSLSSFRRIFKSEFGITAYQWLIKKRAAHIRHRLLMTEMPLTDIIDEFNFSSAQHFSSFCKQYLGDTPINLRKNSPSS